MAEEPGSVDCPEQRASCLKWAVFSWLDPYLAKGAKQTLTQDDIPKYPIDDNADSCYERFEKEWKKIPIGNDCLMLSLCTVSQVM